MLIDLNEIRPQNETFEHFILKQVGRAFLFNQGIRCIGTEVRITGYDNPPFGTKKEIIDVLGINKRNRRSELINKIYRKIDTLAIQHGKSLGMTEEDYQGKDSWKNYYRLKDEERIIFEAQMKLCRERACQELGYDKDVHEKLIDSYKDEYQTRGIEAKASYSDFKNGFSVAADYTYIIAPIGMISSNELPKEIGLLEFDFDKYYNDKTNLKNRWQHALKVTKTPRKHHDSRFYEDIQKRKRFKFDEYARYCQELLFTIAQQNTEEHVFWNPHIKTLSDMYLGSHYDNIMFNYQVGDKNEYGIVCDRRYGKNPNKKDYYNPTIEFYKMIQEGVGMTKWIPVTEIKEWSIVQNPKEKKTKGRL